MPTRERPDSPCVTSATSHKPALIASMSFLLRPASAMALRAASACSWGADLCGTMPISSDSATPTMANLPERSLGSVMRDFLLWGCARALRPLHHRSKLWQGDGISEILEHHLDLHVTAQILGVWLYANDIGRDFWSFGQFDDGGDEWHGDAEHGALRNGERVQPALAAGFDPLEVV